MLDGEKQYHIQLKEGDIADFVILPGDPGRVDFRGEQLQTKAVSFKPFASEDMLSLINEVFEP